MAPENPTPERPIGSTSASTTLADHLRRSPEAYPHSWDQAADAVFFIRVAEADYARASFLDQRILGAQTPGEWMAWDRLAGLTQGLPERLGLIFHIGHVGSTLVSRLLGGVPEILALREPSPLRQLAQAKAELDQPESWFSEADYAARLDAWLKLWSRPFRPGQLPVVKATSFASECAGDILGRASKPSALMLYAKPEVYLAGILAGPNSRQEARVMAQGRLHRLRRRLGGAAWRLWEMSEGERIAMSWACEMTALKAGAGGHEGQVAWMDFDAFLAEPGAKLTSAFAHFGGGPSPAAIEALVTGPMMHQYSKAPEHAYDATLRSEVLASGVAESGGEIRKGMAWLERAAKDHPAIASALDLTS
jgi:hypothetical protein